MCNYLVVGTVYINEKLTVNSSKLWVIAVLWRKLLFGIQIVILTAYSKDIKYNSLTILKLNQIEVYLKLKISIKPGYIQLRNFPVWVFSGFDV